MRYLLILIIILGIGFLEANSVLSFSGMPQKYYGNDIYGIGMGETGISDLFRVNTNFLNPANTITASNVTFSTAFAMGNIWYLDKDNRGFKDDGAYFPYFNLTIPLKKHKFAFCFNSVTSGNLENEQENVWNNYTYTEINRLSASLYKADLIYAYKNDLLNFGLALNYYISHRIQYWKMDFKSTYLQDAEYEIDEGYKNPGFSFGINKKMQDFSFGAVYIKGTDLDGEIKFKYDHSPYTDELAGDFTYKLPDQISAGFTWRFKEKFKINLETHYEMWEESDENLDNGYKFGLGFAYDPLSGYGSWLEQIPLRMGGYIRYLPFRVNNEKIEEKAISFGLSIPLKSPIKQIDLACKYMLRGETDENELRDKSLMFYVGITGFDIFAKRSRKIEHRYIPEMEE